MVAGGDDVCALVEKVFGNPRCEAKAAGRILTVYDDQVDLPLLDKRGEVLADNAPSGLPENVSNE
jgi:hypothetical protein